MAAAMVNCVYVGLSRRVYIVVISCVFLYATFNLNKYDLEVFKYYRYSG